MSYERKTIPWTFLTNHTHVLICLLEDDHVRLKDVALEVGITERAAIRIVSDLEEAGYLVRIREGRRNRYELHTEGALRHSLEASCCVRDLLAPILKCRRKDRGK